MTLVPPSSLGTRSSRTGMGSQNFFLYVEGPRDGQILRAWARRMSPRLSQLLSGRLVIMGGRRPARAIEHFREKIRGGRQGHGLVVLDRDHHSESDSLPLSEPGLEFFTWRRRHIESYVLVPSAIQRLLGTAVDAAQFSRLMNDHLPHLDDEDFCRQLDAKRLLRPNGPLARDLGGQISASSIAGCMLPHEFHSDVIELYGRIESAMGLTPPKLQVVRRTRRA